MDCPRCQDGRYRCPKDDGKPGCPFIPPGGTSEQAMADWAAEQEEELDYRY